MPFSSGISSSVITTLFTFFTFLICLVSLFLLLITSLYNAQSKITPIAITPNVVTQLHSEKGPIYAAPQTTLHTLILYPPTCTCLFGYYV